METTRSGHFEKAWLRKMIKRYEQGNQGNVPKMGDKQNRQEESEKRKN